MRVLKEPNEMSHMLISLGMQEAWDGQRMCEPVHGPS